MNHAQRCMLSDVIVWSIIALVCIAAVCALMPGCAFLKRTAWTGGGAATGAIAGAAIAGPAGAAGGAAIGAITGDAVSENFELRDGTIVGEAAVEKRAPAQVVTVERVPTWCKGLVAWLVLWTLVKLFGYRYRRLIGEALASFVRGRVPTATDKLLKASGVRHSRPPIPLRSAS